MAQTLRREATRHVRDQNKEFYSSSARLRRERRYLLEVGAGEPGHAEELDGVGARDASVAICSSRTEQGRGSNRIESNRGQQLKGEWGSEWDRDRT
jgi:hypothetical protein